MRSENYLRKGSAKVFAVTIMLVMLLVTTTTAARADHYVSYYPLSGDLWYDGQYIADSLFRWDVVGWQTTSSGYEHDLILNPDYLNVCTSWTQLPVAYDDCGTAGLTEDSSDAWAFSFGTYRLSAVADNTFYWGGWDFDTGWQLESPVKLKGQEVYKKWCHFDNVWCMGSNATSPALISTNWSWTTSEFDSYYWSH